MNFISTISSFIGYTTPDKMEQTHFLDSYNDKIITYFRGPWEKEMKKITIKELRKIIKDQNWKPNPQMCRIPGKEWGFSEKGPIMPDGDPLWSEMGEAPRYPPKMDKEVQDHLLYYEPNNGNERAPLDFSEFLSYVFKYIKISESLLEINIKLDNGKNCRIRDYIEKIVNREINIDFTLAHFDLYPVSKLIDSLYDKKWIESTEYLLYRTIDSKFSKSDNTIIKGKDITNKTVLQQLVKFKLKNNIDIPFSDSLIDSIYTGSLIKIKKELNGGYKKPLIAEATINQIFIYNFSDGFELSFTTDKNDIFTFSFANKNTHYQKIRYIESGRGDPNREKKLEGGWTVSSDLLYLSKDDNIVYTRNY